MNGAYRIGHRHNGPRKLSISKTERFYKYLAFKTGWQVFVSNLIVDILAGISTVLAAVSAWSWSEME